MVHFSWFNKIQYFVNFIFAYCVAGNEWYTREIARQPVPHEWVFTAFNMVRKPMETRLHDDVIQWKHFPRYWPFVWGIHRSPVNSPHKAQWRGPLMFTLICVWINDWVNNREPGHLRRYRAHYDVNLMGQSINTCVWWYAPIVKGTRCLRHPGLLFVRG